MGEVDDWDERHDKLKLRRAKKRRSFVHLHLQGAKGMKKSMSIGPFFEGFVIV
jgi:hypothetical protein